MSQSAIKHIPVGFTHIAIQMKFPSPSLLPACMRRALQKPDAKKNDSTRPAGKLLLEETVDFSPLPLLADFKKGGYRMVGMRVEERATGHNKHYMVRATFAPASDAMVVSASFLQLREAYEREFAELLKGSIWGKLEVFSNPVVEEEVLVEGLYWASVVLGERKALRQPDGKPVTVWETNGAGERVGNAPLPLRPTHWLRFIGNVLEFEEAFQPKEAVAA